MKRILVLSVLPLILFALEKVNLIKDAGFEKNSEVWLECAGGDKAEDSATANSYYSGNAFSGSYLAYCDTRQQTQGVWVGYEDTALVIQGFSLSKQISDLDSLTLEYSVIPCREDTASLMSGYIAFYLNAGQDPYWLAGYYIRLKGHGALLNPPRKILNTVDFFGDTLWHKLTFEPGKDMINAGLSDFKVDSFFLMGWGVYYPPWRGQKIYWDDIRLTGYADYDVGIKGILSRDSIGNVYTPTARIKNFGRKPADSFLVIASIEGGSGVVYVDTLSWSLAADTEDTVFFKEFKPSDASNYTLTILTIMTPDESDEDDVMSKTLYGTGVEEQPIPAGLAFEVSYFALSPWVSYSIPAGQQGTISLYDPAGRRVESLRVQGEGKVSLKSGLATGVYFVKLENGHSTITRKAVILR